MQLKGAIRSFSIEFLKFETLFVGMAVRSLSKDAAFADRVENLLDLDARLKLVERLAFARGVPPILLAGLKTSMSRAKQLGAMRLAIVARWGNDTENSDRKTADESLPTNAATALGATYGWLKRATNRQPEVNLIQSYTRESIELQETFRAMCEKLDQHLA